MSDALDNWRWRNPLPQGNPIDGVAFGAGIFVAVTRARTIMTSSNGVDWDLSNVEAHLSRVHYLNGMFAAVGDHGAILKSFTGAAGTWTSVGSGTTHALLDIAYGNYLFVAVGQCGAISTSPDAATWTAGGSGIAAIDQENLYAITFGHGIFVAVGTHGTILTSPDGYTWANRSLGGDEVITGVGCDATGFVAVGNAGDIWNSTDGTTWTVSTLGPTSHVARVDFVGGEFVAVGMVGGDNLWDAAIWSSGDGHNWGVAVLPGNDPLFGSAYGNGVFVAVGFNGTILTSTDGSNWTKRNSDSSYALIGAAYGIDTVVFVGNHAGKYGVIERPVLLTSSDFQNWTPASLGIVSSLIGVIYSGSETIPGIFVAVGAGTILTSSDGTSWNITPAQGVFHAVAHSNGIFVVVGGHGVIVRSQGGVTWTPASSGTQGWLRGVAFGNGTFVAVGDNGEILTSADGRFWAQAVSGTSSTLRGVAYGNGVFVAVGESNTVLTSLDGVSWNQQVVYPGQYYFCERVIYEHDTFVAVGPDGFVMTSPDGAVWTIRDSRVANSLTCAAYGNGSFFVGGTGAAILQAELFQPTKIKSLTPSEKTPQKAGTRVRWTCVATGAPHLQYAFSIAKAGRSVRLRRKLVYSPKNSMVASFDAPGTYVVTVYVKSPHGDVVRKSSAEFKIRA